MNESVFLQESLILLILSEKKSNKTVGKNLSESHEKEVLFLGLECHAESKTCHSFFKS